MMGLVSDDLTGLGPRGFERMCQALATYVLGPGIEAFGSGPDGGREASFRGRVPYPSSADPWDGFGIAQAKFKERILGTGADTTWLGGRSRPSWTPGLTQARQGSARGAVLITSSWQPTSRCRACRDLAVRRASTRSSGTMPLESG